MAEVSRKAVNERMDRFFDLMKYMLKHPEVLEALPEEVYIPAEVDIGNLFTPVRLELLRRIATGDHTVSRLARALGRKVPAVSRDLRVLESHGLIRIEERGKERIPLLRRKLVVVPLAG